MKANEANYIKRLKKQKEDALEFVVDLYLPIVKGIVYKILLPLNNQGMMDECMNDVFLAVWNHGRKFKGDSTDFRKWICTIVKYKAIDYYRKASTEMEFTSEYMDVNADLSVEDQLILRENRNDLLQLMNQLAPIDREIFIMKYFLGLQTAEIARQLNLTNTAVNNRVYRGKKKLSQEIRNFELGAEHL